MVCEKEGAHLLWMIATPARGSALLPAHWLKALGVYFETVKHEAAGTGGTTASCLVGD